MTTAATDIRLHFEPLFHTRPWRVKPGYGSFLTFEFGPRIKVHGHVHGEWHLWIYLSTWVLLHGERTLVDSDSDRRVIFAAVRRLEEVPLSDVQFAPRGSKTTFLFEDFRLVVTPADYLEDADVRDDYWLLYMPNHQVLTVGPGGIRLGSSSSPETKEANGLVLTAKRKFRDRTER